MIVFVTFIKKLIITGMLAILIIPFALAASPQKNHAVKKMHTRQHAKTHKKIPPPHALTQKSKKKKTLVKKIQKQALQKNKQTPAPARQTPPRPALAVQAIHHPINTQSKSMAHSLLPTYLLSSIEKTLVKFVRNTVDSINYTKYKLGGTKIEPKRGVYIVDCSSYVDHILKTVYPQAYSSLTRWSGSQKPTTHDFYQYFINLSDHSRHWDSIDDASDLRPGDILVFRNKSGGHVMIIMDMPERNGNTLILQIADAAPSGHSKDTRQPHSSGIGIGTMLLKINPVTAQPYAYAWKVGAKWQSNVNFAMARPLDFS